MDDLRVQLQEMWQFLSEHSGQFDVFPEDDRQGDAFKARHRAALHGLVAAGELPAPVAERLQVAFTEAVLHVWHSQSLCYMIYPMEAYPRGDLLARAKALVELETGLDDETVGQARAALERDIAFFQAKPQDNQLAALWQSGEIPVDQETRAAAQFLAALLSEERL
jgi:hypothetical protein